MGFGGGAWLGTSHQKKKCDAEVVNLLTEAQKVQGEMLAKVDSLQNLPAQVDTLIIHTETIIEKADTLILIAKDTYLNTDTIKKEMREFFNEKK